MARRVEFNSDGARCVGYLRSAGQQPAPCVVLCNGFGGTQDTPAVTATAADFAAGGVHAFTFDYRNFGESDGRPRQVVGIEAELADIAAAVDCARALPHVDPDRIVLWGTSLGGGHVVVAAARDERIAAVIAQIPFNGFPRHVQGRSAFSTLRLLAAMAEDRCRAALHRSPRYIPAVGAAGELAVMTGPEALEVIAGMDSATWRNQVAPRALIEMMRYRPAEHAVRVRCPALVCIGTRDVESTPQAARALAAALPRGRLREYPLTHFDFYRGQLRTAVVADQLAFLRSIFG